MIQRARRNKKYVGHHASNLALMTIQGRMKIIQSASRKNCVGHRASKTLNQMTNRQRPHLANGNRSKLRQSLRRKRDISTRLDQHWCQRAARWTRTHKPVRVAAVHRCPADGDAAVRMEREVTLDVMRQCCERHGEHGWLRVRGGPWCSQTMTAPPPGLLQSPAPAAREGASSVHPTAPAPDGK